MKKITRLSILLSLSATVFGQQPNPALAQTKQDYLQKSIKQRKTAKIMLYGGGGVFLIGCIVGTHEADNAFINLFNGNASSNFTTSDILLWTGLASMAGSIPLFIASGKNEKKGLELSFKNGFFRGFSTKNVCYNIPSFTIKIKF